jgi:hypothetical protein
MLSNMGVAKGKRKVRKTNDDTLCQISENMDYFKAKGVLRNVLKSIDMSIKSNR